MKRAFFCLFLLLQFVTAKTDTGTRLRKIVSNFDLSKPAKEQLEQPSLGKMKKISRPYRYFPELTLLCSTNNTEYPVKKLHYLHDAITQEWHERKRPFDKFFFTKAGGLFAQSDTAPFEFKSIFNFNDSTDGINKKMIDHLLFQKRPIEYAELKDGNIALSFKENTVLMIEIFPKCLQNLSLKQIILLAKLSSFFNHDERKIHPEWFEILLTIQTKILFTMRNYLPKKIIESLHSGKVV